MNLFNSLQYSSIRIVLFSTTKYGIELLTHSLTGQNHGSIQFHMVPRHTLHVLLRILVPLSVE